jgi:uncharacterized protein (DUF58 family)
LIDPKTLMSIRNLELRARAVVEGFWNGIHRSPYHGFSVEFTEYRQYTPGDDTRHLDWRVYGRSDRYYIKKFEDETNLRCQFVVDQSRSMTYGSGTYTKAEYVATLAATLGWFLHQQGDAIGLLSFDEGIRDFLPPRHRLGHLRQVMGALQQPAAGKGTDLVAPLEQAAALLRKRGMVVILSDFLAPLDRLEQALSRITAGGQEVVVFQVLDPAERTFPFTNASMFEDVESGQTLFVDPTMVRKGYLAKLEAHTTALRGLCEKLGIAYQALETDQALELALFAFLQERRARSRRAPQVRGGTGRGA